MNTGAGVPATSSGYEAALVDVTGGAGAWCWDLRTYFVKVTRQQFRELPLRSVLIPTLDAPALRFDERHAGRAACLASQIEHQGGLYRRTADPFKRRSLASYIRRLHIRRVSMACGYTWPGNPPGWIEFADVGVSNSSG